MPSPPLLSQAQCDKGSLSGPLLLLIQFRCLDLPPQGHSQFQLWNKRRMVERWFGLSLAEKQSVKVYELIRIVVPLHQRQL